MSEMVFAARTKQFVWVRRVLVFRWVSQNVVGDGHSALYICTLTHLAVWYPRGGNDETAWSMMSCWFVWEWMVAHTDPRGVCLLRLWRTPKDTVVFSHFSKFLAAHSCDYEASKWLKQDTGNVLGNGKPAECHCVLLHTNTCVQYKPGH